MKRWATMQLGDVCIAKSGNSKIIKGTLPTENDGTLFPAYSATGQDVFSDNFDFDGPGIVISAVGARCGKCFLANGKWRAIANTHVVLPKPDKANVRFLWYLLNDESFWVKGGTAQPFVKVGDSLKKQIVLPPLEEQERIVKLLDEADALRKLRAQADQRTANLIPALFHKMFDGSKFKSVRIGELTSLVTSGSTPKGGNEVYVNEGPYFIRSQNVRMNQLDLSDVACLPKEVHEQMARTKVASGDVLLNITGASIGRVTWVDKLDREANVSQHVCLIRPKSELLNAVYLSVFISLPTTQNFILKIQSGASRQALNHQQVRALEIPLPPSSLQKEFAQRVSEIRELEVEQATSRAKLDSLFQSMLHRAFRGEL